MELKLQDNHEFVDVGFGTWLIPKLSAKIINNIDSKKLVVWNKYLTTSTSIKRLYNKEYSAQDILIFAARNLVCSGIPGQISITINKNIRAPGFDRISLYELVKLINYGNLNVKGYPVFTDTLHQVAEDIDSYLELYYRL